MTKYRINLCGYAYWEVEVEADNIDHAHRKIETRIEKGELGNPNEVDDIRPLNWEEVK
jgi:hypothetical protein